MPGEGTVFLVATGEPERVTRAALWALTAASVGDRAVVLLAAPALVACRPGGPLDAPAIPGYPGVRSLWRDARELGARVLTCDAELALSGLGREALEGWVDDVVSLPSFWRETSGARLVAV